VSESIEEEMVGLLLLSDSFGSAYSSDGSSLHLNTHGEWKRNGWMDGWGAHPIHPPTAHTNSPLFLFLLIFKKE
jgi:hypothetical protein